MSRVLASAACYHWQAHRPLAPPPQCCSAAAAAPLTTGTDPGGRLAAIMPAGAGMGAKGRVVRRACRQQKVKQTRGVTFPRPAKTTIGDDRVAACAGLQPWTHLLSAIQLLSGDGHQLLLPPQGVAQHSWQPLAASSPASFGLGQVLQARGERCVCTCVWSTGVAPFNRATPAAAGKAIRCCKQSCTPKVLTSASTATGTSTPMPEPWARACAASRCSSASW